MQVLVGVLGVDLGVVADVEGGGFCRLTRVLAGGAVGVNVDSWGLVVLGEATASQHPTTIHICLSNQVNSHCSSSQHACQSTETIAILNINSHCSFRQDSTIMAGEAVRVDVDGWGLVAVGEVDCGCFYRLIRC